MKPLNIFIFLLSLQLSFPAKSQETGGKPLSNPSSLIELAKQASQQTMTIAADFTQVKEMSFLDEKVTSEGKFYFRKEKMLRWEYFQPFSYIIILNNNRIRMIDEGVSKSYDAGSNRMFLEISEVMSGLVNGSLLASNKFKASWFELPDNYQVVLVPEETIMKDYLSKIELKLSRKDFSVDELKIFEKSGDYTQISFRNKIINETIAADIFRVD